MVAPHPLVCRSVRPLRKRSAASLERRRALRPTQDTLLITCDTVSGDYFSALVAQLGLADRVKFCVDASQNPTILVERALRGCEEEGPFRRIYVLTCYHGWEEAWCQAQEMISRHTQDNALVFRMLTSFPSFELWLLLHLLDASLEYGDGSALLACVLNQLKQPLPIDHLGKGPELFALLRPGLPDAMRRAQTLSRLNRTQDPSAPMTEMHELVVHLFKWRDRLKRLARTV